MASRTSFSISSLMRTFTDGVSIVRLLLITILPFAVSFFLSATLAKYFIYPLSAIKGFAYSYCSLMSLNLFTGCGWLIKFLLLFSDSISVIFLMMVWIRILNYGFSWLDVLTSVTVVSAICVIDYCLIIPYLALLFIH